MDSFTSNNNKFIPLSDDDYKDPHPTLIEIREGRKIMKALMGILDEYSCFEVEVVGAERGGNFVHVALDFEVRIPNDGVESCIRIRSKKYTIASETNLEINIWEDVYEDFSEATLWKQLYFNKRKIDVTEN